MPDPEAVAGGAVRDFTVECLVDPDEAATAELARLLPQLSSAVPPDRASWVAIAGAPGTTLLVVRVEGVIVGTATLVTFSIPSGFRAIIEDVVVAEHTRGSGIGAALVTEALRRAQAAGARTVDLTSRPSREAANRLYERAGFVRRETNLWRYSFE